MAPELVWAVVVVVVAWVTFKWWDSNRHLPPGPWGLPLLGYFPFMRSTYAEVSRLSAKYGDVLSFRTVGGQLVVGLSGHTTIKEVLVNRGNEFNGKIRKHNFELWVTEGMGIAQEEFEIWTEHRRFFMQAAKNFGAELEYRIQEEVGQMVTDLRHDSAKQMDLFPHVASATSNVVSYVLFKKKLDEKYSFAQTEAEMKTLVHIFFGKRNMLFGLAFKLSLALYPQLREVRDRISNLSESLFASHTDERSEPRGYVDSYLDQRDQLIQKGHKDGGTFTETRLKAMIFNLNYGGAESAILAICRLLHGLSLQHEVQQKIQAEVDSVVGRERLVSLADRPKLPYLNASIQELYRVNSVFPIAVYSNFKETSINGFRIPRRSAIVADPYSIHFDPEIFPQPQKFDPGRFINEQGEIINTKGLYPFGIGKRFCPAESMSRMLVFILIGALMQNFTLEPGSKEGTVRVIPRA